MPWSHTRPETGPGLHDDPAPPKSPLSSGAGRFLMRPDAGAVQKRHPELDPALLGEEQQALPDTQARPAEEGLGRPRPRPQLSRNGPPLGSILMPPDDRRQRAPQILRRGLIPTRADHHALAQSRRPMDMMSQGWSMRRFDHASCYPPQEPSSVPNAI